VPAAAIIASLNGIRAVPLVQPTGPRAAVAVLTRRLAAGDEAAFREFHALYFDRLYYFLLVVTRGQEHAAQDALQETLLRVVRYARAFETEEALWGWLKVVARNAARDAGRKQRRYFALLERFSFDRADARDTTPPHDDQRLRAILDETLAEIDADDRALIEGKYLRGATVLELAQQTGLSEKAIESRLLRLRRQLTERLRQKLHAS
jgi:RNA polymerase sigma factor (sigma-70 family)